MLDYVTEHALKLPRNPVDLSMIAAACSVGGSMHLLFKLEADSRAHCRSLVTGLGCVFPVERSAMWEVGPPLSQSEIWITASSVSFDSLSNPLSSHFSKNV
jgi:hypothetical protein